jgi:hypothetical protein
MSSGNDSRTCNGHHIFSTLNCHNSEITLQFACYNLQICEQLFGWLTDAEWEGRQQLNGRIIVDSSRHHKVSHQHYGIMGPDKRQHLQKEVPVANMTAQFCDTQLC